MPRYIRLKGEAHDIVVRYLLGSGFDDEMRKRIESGKSYYDIELRRFCVKPREWVHVYVAEDFTDTVLELIRLDAEPTEYKKLRKYT